MNIRLNGSTTIAMVVFLISTSMASLLGYRQYERVGAEEVLVANDLIARGQIVTPQMLELKMMKDVAGGLQDMSMAIGKVMTRNRLPGDVIQSQDLQPVKRQSFSHYIPEDRVLFSLPMASHSFPVSQIKPSDTFDVIGSLNGRVRVIAQQVRLMGTMNNPQPSPVESGPLSSLSPQAIGKSSSQTSGLVIAALPEDIFRLASLGAQERVSLVLHGKEVKHRLPIAPAVQTRQIEIFQGLQRRSVDITL
ncbi:SAF domain-containing protein [Cobetia marina]|uniref:SAF domain-containing protein n=1 Tax=Cobetia marina TaxID=28258 RepID=UPI001144368E|nr:SAF domain-containing protein [Cobetia marina]GED41175.1 hypothetical protein HHA02_05040 [Cobetia marina]